MVVKAENIVSKRAEDRESVWKRLGCEQKQSINSRVCVFWVEGRCNRNPCRFLHTELSPQQPRLSDFSPQKTSKETHSTRSANTWTSPSRKVAKTETALANEKVSGTKVCTETRKRVSTIRGAGFEGKGTPKPQMKLCKFWVDDKCVHGDKCKNLHAWSYGKGFSMLAKLEGHNRAITGIALPSGSSQLFSGSKDKSVRVWDCHSGQCAGVISFDHDIGCLVWNIQTRVEFDLIGQYGQVHAMAVCDNILFAGTEDGIIMVWKSRSEDKHPEQVALLKGHSGAVLSLIVGAKRLYSASVDNTIKVWDINTLQCLQTLHGHTDAVTSVICWDRFLISGSLDNTIKVWAATESGSIEVTYERKEETGVLAFCGIHDSEAKPILICSCSDNSVRLYDLPSFRERGRIFTRGEARSIEIADGGLIFIQIEKIRETFYYFHDTNTWNPL